MFNAENKMIKELDTSSLRVLECLANNYKTGTPLERIRIEERTCEWIRQTFPPEIRGQYYLYYTKRREE